jgi:Fe-S-cluster containining protein
MTDPAAAIDLPAFRCTGCGKCCLEGAGWLPLTEADIARFEAAAPRALKYVAWEGAPGERRGGLSRSVAGGRETARCPFIRKVRGEPRYACGIYDARPDVCRRYPTSPDHARYTGCDGYDVPPASGKAERGSRR